MLAVAVASAPMALRVRGAAKRYSGAENLGGGR
jgi:hypothetical protein